jgi:hypothetical protein
MTKGSAWRWLVTATLLLWATFPKAASAQFVAVGDFNGDGVLDLAVANGYLSNDVSVLLGNGDGTFQPAMNFGTVGLPSSVAVGDFADAIIRADEGVIGQLTPKISTCCSPDPPSQR